MSAVLPVEPSTTQLIAAFAAALAPFAGPEGVAIDGVVNAGLQFLSDMQAQKAAGKTVFTMADLLTIASKTTVDLAKLVADANAAQ